MYSMLSIRVILLSTTVLTAGVMLKLLVPPVLDFAVSEFPAVWSFIVSWLKPPYLYVVMNGIIITLVASSRMHSSSSSSSKVEDLRYSAPLTATTVLFHAAEQAKVVEFPDASPDTRAVAIHGEQVVSSPSDADAATVQEFEEISYGSNFAQVLVVESPDDLRNSEAVRIDDALEEMDMNVISNSKRSVAAKGDSIDLSFTPEKPPVSARFGHRKSVKSVSEGGRTLRVSKPKRQDTLESTWKTITEGRSMPLTRHLQKSDTWETRTRHPNSHSHDEKMSKSETLNISSGSVAGGKIAGYKNNVSTAPLTPTPTPTLSRTSGSGKLRKEPSLSQDELNRRVEAFIRKFNEDMRLQRQESLDQYMEMINRGAH